MKRARGNRGARTALHPDGIVVQEHQEDDPLVPAAAELLGPGWASWSQLGRYLLIPIAITHLVIDGNAMGNARPGDPVVEAPVVSRR